MAKTKERDYNVIEPDPVEPETEPEPESVSPQPTPPPVVGMSVDVLERVLERVGESNAQAMQRRLRRDNPDYNEKSVFTYPEGQKVRPKPELRREVLFCGHRESWEQLTPQEVELYNRFETNKESRDGRWTAEILRRGKRELLAITLPVATTDDRMNLPNGKPLILLELLEGRDATDPVTLMQRVQALEKKLADQPTGRAS